MKDNIKLTLKTTPKSDFMEVFQDMKLHFREDELKTYEKFISIIDYDNYTFLQVKDGDKKIGYILLFIEHGSKFLWLEYFFIKNEFQSMGYGSEVLGILKHSFPDMNGVFMEIEHEDEAFPNTIKRIKFYERNGAEKIDLNYIHPNIEGGRPMYLFYLPIKKDLSSLNKKETLKVIKKAFEYLYKDMPGIDQIYERIS